MHIDLPQLLYFLDIPLVYQTGTTMRELTFKNRAGFDALRDRLVDELSRDTLDALLRLRMDGNRTALLDVICPAEQEYFSAYRSDTHPIRLGDNEHYVDIGAYDGDTVKKFISAARHRYASIHAFEPDPANFQAMRRALGDSVKGLCLHNRAATENGGFLSFMAKGSMGSRADENGDIQVPCVRLDDVLERATLIKMDVEGHEPEVLRGAAGLIQRCAPRLAITCYHHAVDLLDIVEVLDLIRPGAQLRLRHYSLYFYDSVLYAEWPTSARSSK